MKLCLQGLLLVAVFFTTSANAGLLIDPYVGIGSTVSTADTATKSEETASSNVMGARLGYSFLLLSAGIDYSIMNGTDALDESMKVTSTSAFVGVDLPILFRFWGEYFFNSEIDGDTFDTNEASFKDGYSLGVGFTGLPFVSLNIELENLNYDLDVSGNDVDYSVVSTIFSVSLPLDL